MAFDIAIPEDDSRNFADYLDALKRRRKPALILSAAILVLGTVGVFLWPNAYTSSAVVLIEDPEIPPGLVPSTVTTFAARQIQYINQRVMTRTNLANIIEKFNLFPEERKYLPTLLMVKDVEKSMTIDVIDVQQPDPSGRTVSSTIAFTLGFEHENPETARAVANEMVSLYLAENVRSRTEQTAETSQFMQAEVDRLDQEVKELEQQIADIKRKNEGSLPELIQFNMQRIEMLENEALEIDRRLQSIAENKIMLDAELAQLSPIATTVTQDGRPIISPQEQLKALQTELAKLEGRYSPDHPDVLRVKRDLAAVQAQLGTDVDLTDRNAALENARTALAKARESYSEDHPEVVRYRREVESLERSMRNARRTPGIGKLEPDNPAYIQIRAQRESLEAEGRSLVSKQASLRAKRAEAEAKTVQSSSVEKELSALYRRLKTATESYLSARDRLFSAKLGQALETQSKGERFTLVEPPDLPLLPSSPNRPLLLALVVILALAAGLGWPQVAESMDESINSARAIERVQGSPPIAEIPRIETREDKAHDTRVKVGIMVVAPIIAVILLLLVHVFIINLDVLWYVAIRRLGM